MSAKGECLLSIWKLVWKGGKCHLTWFLLSDIWIHWNCASQIFQELKVTCRVKKPLRSPQNSSCIVSFHWSRNYAATSPVTLLNKVLLYESQWHFCTFHDIYSREGWPGRKPMDSDSAITFNSPLMPLTLSPDSHNPWWYSRTFL